MSIQRLVIANFATGYETDRTPFVIDNDAFPMLNNAYVWRGRIPRKRGTSLLGRLERALTSQSLGNTDGGGAFSGNIFSILGLLSTEASASIVMGSITITVGATTFIEPMTPDGTLVGTPSGSGTINYASGYLTLTGAPNTTAVIITFNYYPDLPVMGLEDFEIGLVNQPLLISFDTKYSYGIDQGSQTFYDTTFYKTSGTPFTWNGANYQQFYTRNYLGVNTIADSSDKTGCMWTTNGNPGFHFQKISSVTNANPTVITTAIAHKLITNDWVWFNENSSADGIANLNGKSFQITKTGATTFTIALDSSALAINNTGIFESLTDSGITPTQDGIRWYDGDPTADTITHSFGWVNFAPPLNAYDPSTNPHPFYLVGAELITPFKNRLIFSGVYLTTTATAAPVLFYPNRIVYSQVGTPFYTSPLPFAISTQTPDPTAWYQNVAGKGGFLTAPYDEEIVTISENKDVLLYGFEAHQLKLIYTLDDSLPFIFQTISSEYGDQNTFSAISLDTGVLSLGNYGILMTTEFSSQRIDVKIPDTIFTISVANNNNFRVTAIRDYRNEWVYFTYCPANTSTNDASTNKVFNSKTLLYNYRDSTWATFDENYTHYGTFRRTTNRTWAQLGEIYGTWGNWTDPWNFGSGEAFFPQIVGGNQDGFVLIKGEGTNEANSQFISNILPSTYSATITNVSNANPALVTANNTFVNGQKATINGVVGMTNLNGNTYTVSNATPTQFNISVNSVPFPAYVSGGTATAIAVVYSPSHCLNNGDFIQISNALGITFADSTNNVFQVQVIDVDNFNLLVPIDTTLTISGTYLGGGVYKRFSRPLIQTKQFPVAWGNGRGGRVGTQRYLLQTTDDGQITAQVYSSQNADVASNDPGINPYLTFQNIVLTSPEPNLYGTNPAYSSGQDQIWHRQSNSFNGDTVQMGFTLSDSQMFDENINTAEIIIHAIVLDIYPGPTLS